MLLLINIMVLKLGNINECSLSSDGVSNITINTASLLKIPTKFGFVGNLRFNDVILGTEKIKGLNFDFREDTSSGIELNLNPNIYGSVDTLLKAYTLDLISSGVDVKVSRCGHSLNKLFFPEKNTFRNKQLIIFNYLTNNLTSTISILSDNLEAKEFKVNDNRKIFGLTPMVHLSEKYGIDVAMKDDFTYLYFSCNLSALERKILRESN
jgi:hypothetical protein